MNTKTLLWTLFALLVIGVLAALWYATALSTPPTQVLEQQTPGTGTVTQLPTSGTVVPTNPPGGTGSTTSPSTTTLTLPTAAGTGTVIVADFIHNGTTIVDEVNPERYLLAGNLGYCLSDPQKCQAAPATNFLVFYEKGPQSFGIALTEEPIGQARLAMEAFLLATLGISEQQLCSLKYYVGVTRYVNAQYSTKNLGFSFCPGATKLP